MHMSTKLISSFDRSHSSIPLRPRSFLFPAAGELWLTLTGFVTAYTDSGHAQDQRSRHVFCVMKSISILKKTPNASRPVFSKRFSRFFLRLRLPRCAGSPEKPSLQTLRQPISVPKITSRVALCKQCSLAWLSVESVGRSWETRASCGVTQIQVRQAVMTEELWKKGI